MALVGMSLRKMKVNNCGRVFGYDAGKVNEETLVTWIENNIELVTP